MDRHHHVQVAIFGQNEGRRIGDCIRSVSRAMGARRGIITVILNGSTDNSQQVVSEIAGTLPHHVDLWVIPHADKANAMNEFFYVLREAADLIVCVDAYVTINEGAIDAIEARFEECPAALVATGIATNGRSEPKANERTVREGGIIHGQLYACRPSFLDRMCKRNILLPEGLYRGDGFMGFLARTDLDPERNGSANERMIGVAGAQYTIDQLSPFRWRDIKRQLRRTVRQMRGKIENAAIREIVEQHGFAALPRSANTMLLDYLATHQRPKVRLIDRPFMREAVRQIHGFQPPAAWTLIPVRPVLSGSNVTAAAESRETASV